MSSRDNELGLFDGDDYRNRLAEVYIPGSLIVAEHPELEPFPGAIELIGPVAYDEGKWVPKTTYAPVLSSVFKQEDLIFLRYVNEADQRHEAITPGFLDITYNKLTAKLLAQRYILNHTLPPCTGEDLQSLARAIAAQGLVPGEGFDLIATNARIEGVAAYV